MSVRFELDYSALEELGDKFKRIPGNVENIINSYLHKDGATQTVNQIVNLIPVSKKTKGQHAKTSNPLRSKPMNLGFEIVPKKRFNYLVFPDRGLGTSHGENPQDFMQRGLSKSINDIMEGLNSHIDQYLKEEFE
jgi:hypothetical protein